jgi:predicted permease
MSTQAHEPGKPRAKWWRRRTDEDFAEEIRSHLEHETDRLVAQGVPVQAARATALREFGNVARTRDRFYEARRFMWLEQFARDFRYAWRGMWHSRTFVATTVLTLAVGMGLVTVVFAIFNAYVLRPFAVHDPYSLYSVSWRSQEAGGRTFRWDDYQSFLTRTDLFEGVLAEVPKSVTSDGRVMNIAFVSGNYFDVLGARVALGRGLAADDARAPGSEAVAVLTYQAWANMFGRDPGILGREISVNQQKLVIVGVMAAEFSGLDVPRDMWIPLTMYSTVIKGEDPFGASQPRLLSLTARLRREVTAEQARGSLAIEPFETRLAGRVDQVKADFTSQATPVQMSSAGFALLSPLFAAFGLVLVAACANASNVMLARANARHREIGIRLSIGASRGRIVRQLTTEGLLIAMLAGLAALGLASVLLRIGTVAFFAMLPPTVAGRARLVPLDFDYRVFVFAFLVAGIATLMFALLPALQATRLNLTDALRGQATSVIRGSTLRSLLVTGQVAVSVILLIVAITLVRNSVAIRGTDFGLDANGIVSVRQYRNNSKLVARAYETLSADPRIDQVVVTSRNPLFGETPKLLLRQSPHVAISSYTFVSPEYFSMLGIPILHGRGFSAEESAQEAPVAIVSAACAQALWPGDEPIGKTLRIHIERPGIRRTVADTIAVHRKAAEDPADTTAVTVIGVAKDAISGFVYQGTDVAHLYLPTGPTGSRADALMVRGRSASIGAGTIRTLVQPLDPDPMAFDALAMTEMIEIQMFPIRAASWIGSLLSGIALVLSVSGLYGVLIYTFGQRTQEIGIRMALGATAANVTRLVVVQSARLAAWGTAIGLTAGFTVMKLLSSVVRLDNVSVVDAGAFLISLTLTAVAVALASVTPARRATSIAPSAMLRADA